MNLEDVLNEVKSLVTGQADIHKRALEEIRTKGAVPSEMKEKMDAMGKDCERLSNLYNDAKAEQDKQREAMEAQVKKIEAKQADYERGGLTEKQEAAKTIGMRFIESDAYKEAVAARAGISRKVEIGSF